MMTVLVTGGAGFIGSHIVEELVRRGAKVRVMDNLSTGDMAFLAAVQGRIEFVQGDVTDLQAVRQAMRGITHVVHEAAMRSIPRSLEDPVLCHQINVTGTLQILLAAREAKVRRVVLASSSSVYGDVATYPVREDYPCRPASPYAVSKLAGELYGELFQQLYGLEVVRLRYFNVFGPRMDGESGYAMAVPRFVTSMLRGESPPVFGDGRQSRDFIFVENVAAATVGALEAPAIGPGVFNIGCGQEISVLELVQTINRLLQTTIAPRHLPAKPGESRRTWADIRQARDHLQFEPRISLEDGLSKTIAWFRQPRYTDTSATSRPQTSHRRPDA